MAGIITETLGWTYAFYVPALLTAAITIVWFVIVFDTPAQHPRITKEEQEYIHATLGPSVSKKKVRFII